MNHTTRYEQIDREVQTLRETVRSDRIDPPTCNVKKRRNEGRRAKLREIEAMRNKHLAAAIAVRGNDE